MQQTSAQSDLEAIQSLLALLPSDASLVASSTSANPIENAIRKSIDAIKKGELTGNSSSEEPVPNKNASRAAWSIEPNQYQRLRLTIQLDPPVLSTDQLTLTRRFSNHDIAPLSVADWLSGTLLLCSCCTLGGWLSYGRYRRAELLRSLESWANRSNGLPAQGVAAAKARPIQSVAPDVARILEATRGLLQQKIETIQQSASQSSLVLSAMPVGVMAFDEKLNLLFVNRAGRELLGLPTAAQFGQPLIEVIRQPVVVNLIQQVSVEPQIQEVELELPMSKSTLRLRAHPLAAPNTTHSIGAHTGVLLTVSDETRLKQLENARRDFTANVSHELKTPLSAIKAYAETLLMGALEDEDASRLFVERIGEQAHRLDLLIRDLLHLTKLQSQPDRPELVELDLSDVLKTCVEEHRTIGQAKKVTIDVDQVEKQCRVLSDLESIRTIVGNLLSNAVRYNQPGGWVKVSTRLESSAVVLIIADGGIGIPPEDLDRIFERFYRVEKARSQDAGGTGLGLSIVKHMVQAIGAEISVRSELGKGSEFSLRLKRPSY